MRPIVILLLTSLLLTPATPAFAHRQSTCSDWLKADFGMLMIGNILPVLGTVIVLSRSPWRLLSDAKTLKAASIIEAGTQGKKRKLAEETIDRFYTRLKREYPATQLSKREVTEALNQVYHLGAYTGYCDKIASYGLLKTLFFHGAIERKYFKMLEKAKDMEQAQAIRDLRKNYQRLDEFEP